MKRRRYYKQKKITIQTLIISLIGMLFLMLILDKLFVALFSSIDVPKFYGHFIGLVVPGAGEIINYILPYLKQNKIIN